MSGKLDKISINILYSEQKLLQFLVPYNTMAATNMTNYIAMLQNNAQQDKQPLFMKFFSLFFCKALGPSSFPTVFRNLENNAIK